MSKPQATNRRLTDFIPDSHNANRHTPRGMSMLEDSLQELGAGRSILVDKNNVVIAGNATLETAVQTGFEDAIVVPTDGKQLVVVQRVDIDLNTPQGRKLALIDNRSGQLNLEWDSSELQALLDDGVDLSKLFDGDELAELLTAVDLDNLLGVPKDAKPNPRQLPLDVIYTLQMADCTCCLAAQAGLKYGIQSAHYRLCPYTYELSGRHEVAFIDNDYFHYDHPKHLDAVRSLKPKYATVRDVMTRSQCADAGIDYYDLAQVLDWAEELAEYAQNVIVIPKYDCLDKIPDKFMLGYSVPTSHGGTPLPVAAFKGRRVHLLGGSWKAQLAHLTELGDDVVSLDNNYIEKMASRFGQFVNEAGEMVQLADVGFGALTNPRYAALALSFGSIGAKINELCAGRASPKVKAVVVYLLIKTRNSMNKTYRYIDLITALFVAALLVSNIASSKILMLGVFVLDGGTILFPITYIFDDVLTEVYGYARSRRVVWIGFFCLVLSALTFAAVGALPPAADWPFQESYQNILGTTLRIVLASLAAYFAGEFGNSFVLAKMKLITRGRYLWARTIGSTLIGEGLDTLIFCTVAFAGTLDGPTFTALIVSNYVFKCSLEALFTPVTYRVINFLKRAEAEDYYDHSTDFNPFIFDDHESIRVS